MYILKDQKTSFYLRESTTYSVGRKDCNIILGDNSVSKKHAHISVKDNTVFLQDLKSTNKTFVNGQEVKPNENVTLRVGCEIKFGKCPSIYILHRQPLIVTCSGLNKTGKRELHDVVSKMKGTVVNEWSEDCTYIVVNELILTLKVLCALISKQHIVTVDYFKQCWHAIEQNMCLPDKNNFKPTVTQDMLQKYNEDAYTLDRRTLFKNKVFVFPNNQIMKKMEYVITLAGGKLISFETNPIRISDLLSSPIEYLFITNDDSSQNQSAEFNLCVDFLKKNNIRDIPMPEIAMAVYVGNCELNCNTKYNKVKHVFLGKKVLVDNEVLVPETQTDSEQSVVINTLDEIPGTLEQRTKRGSSEIIQSSQNKKIKLESTIQSISTINSMDVCDDDISVTAFTSTQYSENEKFEKALHSSVTRQEEDIFVASTSKKSINPFASKVKSKATPGNYSKDNPFMKSKKTLSTTSTDLDFNITSSNPFAKSTSILSSTRIDSTQEESKTTKRPAEAAISKNCSKKKKTCDNTLKDSTNIKEEPTDILLNNNNNLHQPLNQTHSSTTSSSKWYSKTLNDNTRNTTDESISDLVNTFVSKVILVSDTSLIVRNPMSHTSLNSTGLNTTMKNFKRFKKVQPVHIQTTIIPRSSYKKLVCGLNGIVSDDDGDDDDATEVPVAVIAKTTQTKANSSKKKKSKFQFNI